MKTIWLYFVILATFGAAPTAGAQTATPQRYRVELDGSVWNPSRQLALMTATTRCFTISTRTSSPAPCTSTNVRASRTGGRRIDFVDHFVLGRQALGQFGATLHLPGGQRARLSILPAAWHGVTNISRFADFAGKSFGIGAVTTTRVGWTATTVGYQWDALSTDAGSIGIMADLNHHRVAADISAPRFDGTEQASYRRTVTIPTLGLLARLALPWRISVTGEFPLLRLAGRSTVTGLRHVDYNATLDLSERLDVRAGFRSVRLDYGFRETPPPQGFIEEDAANLRMKAPYLSAVVRF